MKLQIVESIIGSILALLGDTFYAGNPCGLLFAVVLEKNPVSPGQKKLLRGASKSLPSYGFCFFTFFEVSFPTQGSILAPFKEGLWKRLCVSVVIRFFKHQLFCKKCFLGGVLSLVEFWTLISDQASIWSPLEGRGSGPCYM